MNRIVVACLLALVAGATAWFLGCELLQAREAWDEPAYYWTVLPALALVTGLLGFAVRGAAVALGLATGLGQSLAMFSAGIGNLWPVGLAIMAVLSIPCIGSAWAGQALRKRLAGPVARR